MGLFATEMKAGVVDVPRLNVLAHHLLKHSPHVLASLVPPLVYEVVKHLKSPVLLLPLSLLTLLPLCWLRLAKRLRPRDGRQQDGCFEPVSVGSGRRLFLNPQKRVFSQGVRRMLFSFPREALAFADR